jgi:Fur family zinc uptake transcriptional regulator
MIAHPEPALAFASHDHRRCSGGLIARAEAIAAEKAVRLTPVRRRVLEILIEGHRALGAYEVLDRLALEGFGSQPPVVYRALDFLTEQGLVHRIAGLNAYMACTHPGTAHTPALLICRSCRTVAEAAADDAMTEIATLAEATGFEADRVSIEVLGACPSCRCAT